MNNITRREFIDGVASTVLATSAFRARASSPAIGPYPPSLTGFRGSRDADLEVAHEMRDGAHYRIEDFPVTEEVDCAIVGAGIAGLTAAYTVRQGLPKGRILILDNHDDFGGHARRNEFTVDGRLLIGYGGSESIQSPDSQWSPTALRLLSQLGVDVRRFQRAIATSLYPGLGLSPAMFFEREQFGVDRLVTGDPQRSLPNDIPANLEPTRAVQAFWADAPLSAAQRQLMVTLYTEERDLFPGRSRRDKRELLEKMSYAKFLETYWQLDPILLTLMLGRTRDLFALSADLISAWAAAGIELPGFQGLDLGPDNEMNYEREPYIYHFPDGNASIARLLVRALIPQAASGSTMDDVVTAPFAYDALDAPSNATRLRLSSTVVALKNTATHAELLYVGAAGARRVRARRMIYSGYGAMFPYLCAEVPPQQREALQSCVRLPLVYVTAALRHWRPFVRAGVDYIYNPTGFYTAMKLDYPVSLGAYRFARSPDEPILLHLSHIPQPPAPIPDRQASLRAARSVLYGRPFSDFEGALRDVLTRAVGPFGFDADADLAAITVNRWGHGYANDLGDPRTRPAFAAISQRHVGRISIGSSDTGWDAYAHVAIDQGSRAAREVLAGLHSPGATG